MKNLVFLGAIFSTLFLIPRPHLGFAYSNPKHCQGYNTCYAIGYRDGYRTHKINICPHAMGRCSTCFFSNTFIQNNVLEYENHWVAVHCCLYARSLEPVTKDSRIGMISSSGIAKERYWKRILIVDDNPDITNTIKVGIENTSESIVVHTHNDPRNALLDFGPNLYDLLSIDIDMPYMNGFKFSERILKIYINVKICFMSVGEINRDALREIHPSISLGCFIKKPVTIDYLVDRIMQELD